MDHLDRFNDFINEDKGKWFPGKRKLMKKKKELEKELEEQNKKSEEINKKIKEEAKKSQEAVKKLFKDYIGKKYDFQYFQHVWTSNSTNYEEIDIYSFELLSVMGDVYPPNFQLRNRFILLFKDRYGLIFEIHFYDNTPTQNLIDLEYAKPWDKNLKNVLIGHYDKKDVDIKTYPNRSRMIDLVPTNYASLQLLKFTKELLDMSKEQFKNN